MIQEISFSKKVLYIAGYILVLILVLAGCQSKVNSVTVFGPKELAIGVVLPKTGQHAELGKSARQGIEFAVDELNKIGGIRGIALKATFIDDNSQPVKSAQAVSSLAEQPDIVAVIGGLTDELAFAGGIQANRRKIVFITPAAGAIGIPELGPYVYRNKMNYSINAARLAEYLFQIEGKRSYAIMYPFNEYGVNMAEIFARRIKELGGVVAGKESYTVNTYSFNSTIARISSRELQVLFVPCYASELPGIAEQLYQNGVMTMLAGVDSWTKDGKVSQGIGFLEGAIYTSSFYIDSHSRNVVEFVQQYKQKFGETPDTIAAHCVDTVRLLAQCIYAGGFNREAIKNELLLIKNYPGLTGKTTFGGNREAEKQLLFLTVERGEIEKIQ
ncbi:MAG: ABC transporter substrate-binding protein [Elusimicrobia bacterium]|nr:ABC transporter substrate-binding protein [Elusimicrobiota bacterium]